MELVQISLGNASGVPAIIVMGIFLQLTGSQALASDNILSTIKNSTGNISISVIPTERTEASTSEDPSTAAQTIVPWVTRYGADTFLLEEASTTERSMTSIAIFTPPVNHSTDASISTAEASRQDDDISTFVSSIAMGSITQHLTSIPTNEDTQHEGITVSLDSKANATATAPVNSSLSIGTEATIVVASRINDKMLSSMTIEAATESSVINKTPTGIASTGTIFLEIVNSSTTSTQSGSGTETSISIAPDNGDQISTFMAIEAATESSIINETPTGIASTGTIFLEIVNSSTTSTQSSSGTETSISIAPDNGDQISTFMATITASETISGTETIISAVSRTHTETFVASSPDAVSSRSSAQTSLLANSPTTLSSISTASETLTSLDFTRGIEPFISEMSITSAEATVPLLNITSTESSLLKILFPISDTATTKATFAGSISSTLASTANYEDAVPVDSSSGGDISTPTISGNDDETSLPIANITAFGSLIPVTESSKRKSSINTAVGNTVEISSILTNITTAESVSVEENSSFVAPGSSPEPTFAPSSTTVTEMSPLVSSRSVADTSDPSANIAATETSSSVLLTTNTEIFSIMVSRSDARTQISVPDSTAAIGAEVASSLASRSSPEISISTDSTTQTSILSVTTCTARSTISLAPKITITSQTHTTDQNPTLSREILEAVTGTNVTPVINVTSPVPIPKAMPAPTIMTSTMTSGSAGLPFWAIIPICLTTGLALLLLLSLPFLILGLPFPRLVQPRTYFARHLIWESDLGIELESGVENRGRSEM